MRAAIRPTIACAGRAPVRGRRITNSSPPKRATTSSERVAWRIARATVRSTSLPTRWPAVSGRVGDLDLEALEQAATVQHAGEVIIAGETPRLGVELRVRDRDRRLRRVEAHQTLRLSGEDAAAREICRE